MLPIKVGDVMTRNFISVKPETTVIDCAKTMIKNKVGSLILQENDKLAGLITEKDIIWALVKSKEKLSNIKAKDISLRKVPTIRPSATLEEALDKIQKTRLRWLPVVHNEKTIGMLTLKDILKFHPAFFEVIREDMTIREFDEKRKRIEISSICEECGNYGILEKTDGRLLCENCR